MVRFATIGLEHTEVYTCLDSLRRRPDAQVVGIAEHGGRLRMAAQGRYHVPVFPSAAKLLAGIECEAVVVGTPNGEKAQVIRQALAAGKHVLSHAPAAISVAQAHALAEMQAQSGKSLLLLLPLRFAPAYQALKRLVAEGKLGSLAQIVAVVSAKVAAEPRTPEFYAARQHGGIITTIALHQLDICLWLAGRPTVRHVQTGQHRFVEYPEFGDVASLHCDLQGGGSASIICNWLAPEAGEPFQELTVFGTHGTAWIAREKLRALAGAASAQAFLAPWDEPPRALESGNLSSADPLDALVEDVVAAFTTGKEGALKTSDALFLTTVAAEAEERAGKPGTQPKW